MTSFAGPKIGLNVANIGSIGAGKMSTSPRGSLNNFIGFGLAAGSGGTGLAQSLMTALTPVALDISDGVPYELGIKLQFSAPGFITAIRYWKAATDATATHVGRVWSAAGAVLASVNFAGESASGWQQQALGTPLAVAAATTYVITVGVDARFAQTLSGLATPLTSGNISSVADVVNGVFGTPLGSFPTGSFSSSNYFRDVVFATSTMTALTAYDTPPVDFQNNLPIVTPQTTDISSAIPLSGSTFGWTLVP